MLWGEVDDFWVVEVWVGDWGGWGGGVDDDEGWGDSVGYCLDDDGSDGDVWLWCGGEGEEGGDGEGYVFEEVGVGFVGDDEEEDD